MKNPFRKQKKADMENLDTRIVQSLEYRALAHMNIIMNTYDEIEKLYQTDEMDKNINTTNTMILNALNNSKLIEKKQIKRVFLRVTGVECLAFLIPLKHLALSFVFFIKFEFLNCFLGFE